MTEQPPRYQPTDSSVSPRFTGVRTYARCPLSQDWDGADAAIIGVPFDTATSFRPGARYGPAAIREMSLMMRRWHPVLEIDIFNTLSVVDGGDVNTVPGNAERTTALIAEQLMPVIQAETVPVVLGGDHSIVLGELRAHARRHGPLGLVLLDAHADTWDSYWGERYVHGTPFRRALDEGLIEPRRSLLAGMRGSLYAAADYEQPREWGFEIVSCEELRTWSPERYGERVRERLSDGPAYLSFDIDVLDPAFAPGTGTPEISGLLSHEAQAFLRALAGIEFVGFDVVEVSPTYDGPGQVTALQGATVAFEMLALTAIAKATRRGPRQA
ncbi:MAG TPA: agmatinase [Solirubrobacteraceae bacterium]|nr:agmatinase [Solirubrobacteraceae bacterium]